MRLLIPLVLPPVSLWSGESREAILFAYAATRSRIRISCILPLAICHLLAAERPYLTGFNSP